MPSSAKSFLSGIVFGAAAMGMGSGTAIASAVPEFLKREAARPETIGPVPHRQTNNEAPMELQNLLVERINALSYAQVDKREHYMGRDFIIDGLKRRYIGHLHYRQDGSAHVSMPQEWISKLTDLGWGEPHPGYPDLIFLAYAPQTHDEVDTVFQILKLSFDLARE